MIHAPEVGPTYTDAREDHKEPLDHVNTIPAQPPPAADEGTQLHLRAPKNKAERRLIRDIQGGLRAREAAMGQLARANRKVAEAERGLRQAGMVTADRPPEGTEPPGCPHGRPGPEICPWCNGVNGS